MRQGKLLVLNTVKTFIKSSLKFAYFVVNSMLFYDNYGVSLVYCVCTFYLAMT